jgi:hypothetical protein
MEVLAKILFADTPRISDLRDGVPPALEDLIARMMANSPDVRPTISEVVSTLEEVGHDAQPSTPRLRGSPEPAAELPAVTGDERALVAIVLADDRAWTETAPTVSLDQLHDRVAVLSEGVAPLGGRVEVLMHGATAATFSAEGEAADLAGRAARASRAIRKLMPRVRIAVALSRVNPASETRLSDAVTTAGRLIALESEASALAEGIRLDATVARLLDARFDVVHDAYGFALQGESPPDISPWCPPRGLVPFVGRERETRMLAALAEECLAEPPAAIALVTGPAGAGKSRLGLEVLKRIKHEAGARGAAIWSARGDPVTQGAAFSTFGRLVSSVSGLLPDDAEPVRRNKLATFAARHLVGDAVQAVADALFDAVEADFVEPSLGPRAARLDPSAPLERFARAWAELVIAETRAHPVILVLEDLQWVDRSTVRLLSTALRAARDTRLLVLAFARPEVHDALPELFAGCDVHAIRLFDLAPSASRRLFAKALGHERTLPGLIAEASGNAFHLAELARAAEGASSSVPEILPETVLCMAQARIERLDAGARRALRAASIFGGVFWASGIATLQGAEAASSLGTTLATLGDAGIIVRQEPPRFPEEEEYAFAKPLVRFAAYRMLTERDRTTAHRLAAEWLESRGERESVVLAEHFERGGEPKSAVVWYLWAAEQAFEANDLETVVTRTKRGIASGAEGTTLGELLLLQAEAVGWAESVPNAAFGELASSCIVFLTPGTGAWCRAAAQVVVACARAGDVAELEAMAARLAATPRDASLGVSHVLAMAHAAYMLYGVGLLACAAALVSWVETAVPHAHEDDAETFRAAGAWLQGLRALHDGAPGPLCEMGPLVATTLERVGHARFAALAMLSLARALAARGAVQEAASWARRAADLAERIGLGPVGALAREFAAPKAAPLDSEPN